MNTYKLLAAATLGFVACGAVAQSVSTITPQGATVKATAVTPNIIRVDNIPAGAKAATVQSVLDISPEEGIATLSKDGTSLSTVGGVTARIAADGSLYISGSKIGTGIFDNGFRYSAAGRQTLFLGTSGKGSFYGAGERGHRYNLRGDTLVMYNRQNYGYTGNDPRISQMNITMPLVLNSAGYALVFDDFAAAQMQVGDAIRYTTESALPVTYYYVGGVDNMAELTEELTELTGRQPLPPLWALGYITSKYGYRTQAETEGTVDTLKQRGYPVDGIVLDLYWYGKEQDMGRLAWEPSQWPDAAGMLGRLKDRGVNTVTISQPYVLRNGRAIDNYRELADKKMFVTDSTGAPQEVVIWVGEGGMFDVANADTRRWLTDRYKQLTDMGVGGWWGDLGEPEVHPETGMHANGLPARLYHNKYGNDWSSIISELYAKEYPDTRLLTLMRGGTIGLQRHSVFPWSTDVSRSWGGLQPQIRIMLNSGLSGLGYMSSDLGGFAVDEANPYLPELYVRWLQAGLFTPVFRTHAQQYAEPYKYPQYEDIIKALVLERYRWLPYNYTLAYENAAFGYPLVRPLDFTDSKADGEFDSLYNGADDEYMWGNELLVAPVITEGATSRPVVFPAGSKWIDYSRPSQVYEGGTRADAYPAPLAVLPLFVRGGAFIPTADYPMENTADYRANEFTVSYYPAGGESSYTLYDDNRISPRALADGQYRLIHFKGVDKGDSVEIEITSEGSYTGAPETVDFTFKVYMGEDTPREYKLAFEAGKTGRLNIRR